MILMAASIPGLNCRSRKKSRRRACNDFADDMNDQRYDGITSAASTLQSIGNYAGNELDGPDLFYEVCTLLEHRKG